MTIKKMKDIWKFLKATLAKNLKKKSTVNITLNKLVVVISSAVWNSQDFHCFYERLFWQKTVSHNLTRFIFFKTPVLTYFVPSLCREKVTAESCSHQLQSSAVFSINTFSISEHINKLLWPICSQKHNRNPCPILGML